jgi:transcriptional regulator with XRE-family HTH domain
MTQEDLAAAASVDRTVISKLETGKIGYTQETLEALSKALTCKSWQLIGVDPIAPVVGVVDIWDRIPEANKDQARRTLQSFTDGLRKA